MRVIRMAGAYRSACRSNWPTTRPTMHPDVDEARTEAERLAQERE
jgi:hypothetical protein